MNVILFGATGMVGRGVLRECLLDEAVGSVLVIGRSPLGLAHPKLREIVRADPTDLSAAGVDPTGFDACFFCLGVSAAGMKEEAYRRVTYDLTIAVARVLAAARPGMTFAYVSGEGTDSTEQGRSMWARVKGRTENELLRMPLRAYMFRPGIVLPQHGVVSRTPLYRAVYAVARPLLVVLRRLAPGLVTTGEQLGRAMVAVAAPGAGTDLRILRPRDINRLARTSPGR